MESPLLQPSLDVFKRMGAGVDFDVGIVVSVVIAELDGLSRKLKIGVRWRMEGDLDSCSGCVARILNGSDLGGVSLAEGS